MSIPKTTTHSLISTMSDTDQLETLIEVFGEHMFWARNSVLTSIEGLVNSEEKRERLARILREPYERASSLDDDQKKAVMELLQSGIDSFAKELLRIIGNEGLDLRMNEQESIRYRLESEVCNVDTGEVSASQIISRGGTKFLPERWGRWLNKFRR